MTRDPLANPFTPGYGNLPRVFAGRTGEFADLELLAGRVRRRIYEQARQVTGVRGIGKTALLREYAEWARGEGFWVVEIAALPGVALQARLARSLGELVAGMDLSGRVVESVRTVLRTAAGIALRYGSGDWHVQYGGAPVEPSPASGDEGADVERLLGAAVELAADRGTALLLLVDEAQNADPAPLGALLYALQAVQGRTTTTTDPVSGRRDRLDAPLGVVLSGLPSLPSVIRRARATFMTRSRAVVLDPLEDAAVREALPAFTRPLDVGWDADALDLAVQLIAGYPYFLHVYGFHAWLGGDGPVITHDAVAAGARAAGPAITGFYDERLEEVTALQLTALSALAGLPDDRRSPGDLAQAMGRHGGSEIGSTVEGLIAKGLIRRAGRASLTFQLPGMADHLRDRADR